MNLTVHNIMCLAQLDARLSSAIKEQLKSLPGEAFSDDVAKLHNLLNQEESAGLLHALSECGLMLDDIMSIQNSPEMEVFVTQSVSEQEAAIEKLKDIYYREQLDKIFNSANKITKSNLPISKIIEEVANKLYSLPTLVKDTDIEQTCKSLQSQLVDPAMVSFGGAPTGYKLLDEKTGGMITGALWVLGGDTGQGKTAMALNIARNWLTLGKEVLYISLEMSNEEVIKRMIYIEAAHEKMELNRHHLAKPSEETKNKAIYLLNIIKNYSLRFFNSSNISEICQKIKQSSAEYVIIDHMHLIDDANDTKELAKITRILKRVSVMTNKKIIALAQYNRVKDVRDNKSPQLGDFRGSSTIEQDANVVLGLHCPNKDANPYQYEIHILKAREGDTGIVPVFFEKPTQIIRETLTL